MRKLFFSVIAIPLLVVDGLFLWSAPGIVTRFYSWNELFSVMGGGIAYGVTHGIIRKPERLYLWGHEVTHLVVAKLFFKTVHGFHITSRDGGRVIIDGTNIWIDLAPYIFPSYNLLLLATASIFRPAPPWGTAAYLVGTGFLFTMHLAFSLEGFLQGQPDLNRSGRFFSFALVVLFLIGTVPILFAPGVGGAGRQVANLYACWGNAAYETGRILFLAARAFHF